MSISSEMPMPMLLAYLGAGSNHIIRGAAIANSAHVVLAPLRTALAGYPANLARGLSADPLNGGGAAQVDTCNEPRAIAAQERSVGALKLTPDCHRSRP